MTRDERIDAILKHIREQMPEPTPVLHQYVERDFYARVQPRTSDTRDWSGSSAAGREWGGARWSGGRDV